MRVSRTIAHEVTHAVCRAVDRPITDHSEGNINRLINTTPTAYTDARELARSIRPGIGADINYRTQPKEIVDDAAAHTVIRPRGAVSAGPDFVTELATVASDEGLWDVFPVQLD